MSKWGSLLLGTETTLFDTLRTLAAGSAQIVLIVDENRKLLGTVTDGDIRRGILKGCALTDPVKTVMNGNPVTLIYGDHNNEALLALMVKNHIHQLPLVDKKGCVQELLTMDALLNLADKPNLVVIMSGGLGKRLKPLTDTIPKPMLKMGGKPLLESNIEKLKMEGFKRFCITVGYKAEMIKSHFGDGSRWDVSIEYIHEDKPLGTAGALSYLPKEQSPILVMNGDLLTSVKFSNLMDFHEKNAADFTLCVRSFEYQFPYGVVELDNHTITGIKEKPLYKHYVNAGVYVMNPSMLEFIPKDTYFPMTDLIENLISMDKKVQGFPLMEYWSDIGQLNDYEKACQDFEQVML